jgi:hypothetical protein
LELLSGDSPRNRGGEGREFFDQLFIPISEKIYLYLIALSFLNTQAFS